MAAPYFLQQLARRWVDRRGSAALVGLDPDQEPRFRALAARFAEKHAQAAAHPVDERLLTPSWARFNKEAEGALLPAPDFRFLRHPVLQQTMHVAVGGEWLDAEMAYLERRLPEAELSRLLQEDPVGGPIVLSRRWLASHNGVHTLYHLVRYAEETGAAFESADRIVEWGGGYGNLAKLIARRRTTPGTHVIVDTPLFSALQWLYLATALGEDKVHLATDPKDGVVDGRVNLVPVGLAPSLDLRADAFVSTWALSESGPGAQEFVRSRDWFGAKRLLLAYAVKDPAFPHAMDVEREAARKGAKLVDIPFLKDNRYAFL